MAKRIEDAYQQTTVIVTAGIKKYVYDLVAAIIIVAIIVASLRIFDFADDVTLVDILVEFVPFYSACLLLGFVRYEKGAYVGKQTQKFTNAVDEYSGQVDKINGDLLAKLPAFCEKFNDDALKTIQTRILKAQGLKYEYLYNEFDYNGVHYKSLCNTKTKELKLIFTKKQVRVIKQALNASVKTVSAEKLMTELNSSDPTDIGQTEVQLKRIGGIKTVVTYLLAAIIFAFIAVRDVNTWNWNGLYIVLFKTVYAAAKAYKSYFQAYDDITIKLLNHILRKNDILKQYVSWYDKEYNVKSV